MFRMYAARLGIQRAAIAVLLATLLGCGKAPVPSGKVMGKVTLQGKPFELGVVMLVKPNGVPIGSVELSSAGEFQFSDPVPVGEYRVAIGLPKEEAPADAPASRFSEALKVLPPKYRNDATSGFVAVVKEGDNHFTFDMQ